MAERTVPAPAQVSQTAPAAPATQGRATDGHEPTRSEQSFIPPAVDIYEEDQGLVILADLPGVEPNSLDVRIDRGILTIQGKASHLATGEPIYRAFELTGFFRQFQLPDEIDVTRVPAELKNGVLTLRLPRAEHAKPRRIQVQAT